MESRDLDARGDILTAIRRVQGFPIPDRETFLASDACCAPQNPRPVLAALRLLLSDHQ